ncbi:MAG: hypothetical protein V5A52_00765 [Halovenus sp.]|uniref:hypothetical protein n=1 Tax=Halovenus amylolytica TaxID=2500550 RepID=UPI000FE39E8B
MEPTNTIATGNLTPQLPDLDGGLVLLELDGAVERAVHALAVDHVLQSGGDACWIDPGTNAQTDPLVELAPSDRILDRIAVARGFTAFQHLELLRSLPEICPASTELIVVPAIDRYYRDDGLLADEGREMLLSGIAALAGIARERAIPVVLTRTVSDEFSQPVESAADHTIACERTPFGPRFRTDGEETLIYPVDGGRWVQTTISFWERILAVRASAASERAQPEVTARGAN